MTTADPVEILSRLAAGGVDFIVVGMAAGILRGAPVTTAMASMPSTATTRAACARRSHTW